MYERTEEERDQLERRLAEQEVFRQALTAKTERLAELEAEVTYLRRTLNELLAAPRPQPQPAYAPARKAPASSRTCPAAIPCALATPSSFPSGGSDLPLPAGSPG